MKRNFLNSIFGFLGFPKTISNNENNSESHICKNATKQYGEIEIEEKNGFGEAFTDGEIGNKVLCLQFSYETDLNGKRNLKSAIILKGVIVQIDEGFYIVKMDYYKDGPPEHYPFKHVLPLTEEEYKSVKSCEHISCGCEE